jgi:hypothetical protein
VIVGAALCPWPPVLARPLTGTDPVCAELREACLEAVRRLVAARPAEIVVVGPADVTRTWPGDSGLDLSVFAPPLQRPGGDPGLPPALGLGAMLLDQAGYTGHRAFQAVAQDEPVKACADLGGALGLSGDKAGLLVMGDGSARRTPQAPGSFDSRAVAFDAANEQAIRAGDLAALLSISPALAADLMATGRPAWQVLAGAVPAATADILYADDPFGVGYLVAYLESLPAV